MTIRFEKSFGMTADMAHTGLTDLLEPHGQGHVLRFWKNLSASSKKRLADQVRSLDFGQIAHFQRLLKKAKSGKKEPFRLEPAEITRFAATDEQKEADEQAVKIGVEALRRGRVGVFLVAGGQGTRLGFNGPKGCFPIGPVSRKSIFQMHAEKILAASGHYGAAIPWTIMTSRSNDSETRTFFEENGFFGLNPRDVFFVPQRMAPCLDESGLLILDAPDHMAESPNGHGGALLAMEDGGVLEESRKRGVDILSYFQVDNVLIRIIDPLFIGHHLMRGADMSSKMVRKRGPSEKLGHFGLIGGRLHVIEYSDMTEADMKARNPDGSLKYEAGSIGIHLIRTDFVQRELNGGLKLPFHIAHKKIPFIDENGKTVNPVKPNGYKFETFIFDALQNAAESLILEVRRGEEFSPVKNKDGEDSPETARRDLSCMYLEWLEAAGMPVPPEASGDAEKAVEISPLFAIDRKALTVRRQDIPPIRFPFYLYP
jgi:UDP-N-acetylglucosamine/UDP-N-acetylgalactosamine diphosphorylase